ncbi:unnamed protein product [Penicillium salamii]|nr:unnamed protein product [Penicillium salamii]
MSVPLPDGCGVCGKEDNTRLCTGCRVMPYGSVEHQSFHRPEHKSDCNRIKKCSDAMKLQEKILRLNPLNDLDVFEESRGRFWEIWATRPYMDARLNYRAALTFIRNATSVKLQLPTLMETMNLYPADSGVQTREIIPAVMIRLDKDQECYDFLKWWATHGNVYGERSYHDSEPFLNIKDANPLEPVEPFLRNMEELPHIVCLTLIKIRLYMIMATKIGAEMNDLPKPPIFDGMSVLNKSSITTNPSIASLEGLALAKAAETVMCQIQTLYDAVNDYNPLIWPELLDPDETVGNAPMGKGLSQREQANAVQLWTWLAWAETYGATSFLRELFNKHDASFCQQCHSLFHAQCCCLEH